MMRNKKGIAPIAVIVAILLGLGVFYMLLFLPIPAFKAIRMSSNFFMVLVLWFTIQAIFIYGYFKLGQLIFRGIAYYKMGLKRLTQGFKKWLLIH
jgi:hypothetical protein